MTGGQRLKIALDLHEKACKAARAEIRKQFPDATEAQLGSKFREWLAREQAAERAELGKQGY